MVHLSIFLASATPKPIYRYCWNLTLLLYTAWICAQSKIIQVLQISREITVCVGRGILCDLIHSSSLFRISCLFQQAEIEQIEKSERVGGAQQHKRITAALGKQIQQNTDKLQEVSCCLPLSYSKQQNTDKLQEALFHTYFVAMKNRWMWVFFIFWSESPSLKWIIYVSDSSQACRFTPGVQRHPG